VADTNNSTIRKITPGGVVSTPAGFAGFTGSTDGTGSDARFGKPRGLTVDQFGNVFVADTDNSTIRKITSAGVVTTLAGAVHAQFDTDGTGSVARFAMPIGITVDSGGTLYVADTGNWTIRKGVDAPRPLNISTRMKVLTGDNVLIAGFIITGPANSTKQVMIRGLGPSLAQGGVPNPIADPLLELHGPNDFVITNDSWGDGPNASSIPNGFQPNDPREAVIIAALSVGADGYSNYSVILKGSKGETGVGLVEAYDLTAGANQLANISTRGFIDTGDNVMIAGFIIGGTEGGTKVLIRGIGPSLPLGGTLADPTLELHDSQGAKIRSNDNWKVDDATGQSQEDAIRLTTIPPSNDLESAVLDTFPPGVYTAILAGHKGGTGVGLVEVYNLR
jgi:hypothetical protein